MRVSVVSGESSLTLFLALGAGGVGVVRSNSFILSGRLVHPVCFLPFSLFLFLFQFFPWLPGPTLLSPRLGVPRGLVPPERPLPILVLFLVFPLPSLSPIPFPVLGPLGI